MMTSRPGRDTRIVDGTTQTSATSWNYALGRRAGIPAVFRVLCVILKASDVFGCACRRVVEDATPSQKAMEPDPYEFVF